MDRLRVQHVLFTLVQNALESPTPDNEPPNVHIDVTCDRYGLQVAVEDRGDGLNADVTEHLFRPFFTTKPHGTGLGLASSRAIIEAHDGSIGFQNLPEGGARFWFQLPVAIEEMQETRT
ncbi:MAG: ATP-binding protein [Steroidobacteraceae bacterium]